MGEAASRLSLLYSVGDCTFIKSALASERGDQLKEKADSE